ncbi:MAG TPA: transcription termination factor NusA [Candidatus Dormibacteraeota bacterium]|nr:transcription termination factor NusA [Candidatus Dormibacteraeota bacterium]
MEQVNFLKAIDLLTEEKNLPRELVVETVEAALAAAYKKDYGDKDQVVRTRLNEKDGSVQVYVTKEIVKTAEEVENPHLQISLEEAKKHDKDAKVGVKTSADGEEEPNTVEYEEHPKDFGRVAAQTAKQVIIQRLREAEREIVFNEYKDKEETVLNGVVQRVDGNIVYVDLGKSLGVLFASEQIPGERYYNGQRVKVYVVRVEQTSRGPQIVLSRAHPNIVKALFEMEVPELESGAVEIKGVAREAGTRSKVAVLSNTDGVDAVGTFVGGRGARVQAVMGELGEEKIDIILYDEDPKTYIINALSPTKVISVELDEKENKATVKVPEDQLSLAIGKQGQNVRLAAKLTNWNIDIVSADESKVEAVAEAATEKKSARRKDLEGSLIEAVEQQIADETSTEAPTAEEAPEQAETPELEEETAEALGQEPAASEADAPKE